MHLNQPDGNVGADRVPAGQSGILRCGYAMPDRVWVRLRTEAPLDEHTVTGTTARAVIKVR